MVGKHPKDIFSSIITEYEGQWTTILKREAFQNNNRQNTNLWKN